MADRVHITAEYIRSRLDYDPETGIFTWRNGWRAGKRAGFLRGDGYRAIRIGGQNILEQRAAWVHVHGVWPLEVDHDNRILDDNRIANLKDGDHANNMKNRKLAKTNKSGHPGVVWEKRKQLWVARIPINGKLKTLGRSKSLDRAIELRQQAERELGYHVNHGRAA